MHGIHHEHIVQFNDLITKKSLVSVDQDDRDGPSIHSLSSVISTTDLKVQMKPLPLSLFVSDDILTAIISGT